MSGPRSGADEAPRCVFLVEDWPLSRQAAGGAGALIVSHLELLLAGSCRVQLLVLRDPRAPKGFDAFTAEQEDAWLALRRECAEFRVLELEKTPRQRAPLRHAVRGVFDPSWLYLDVAPQSFAELSAILSEWRSDLIWAEHLLPAALACRVSSLPVIYGHHDWSWRIKTHRQGRRTTWRGRFAQRLKAALRRRFEERLVRGVAGCVSGSASESAELRRLGGGCVAYLPTTFARAVADPVPWPDGPPRLVHLGGLQTTATRLGLERFLDVVWPRLRESLGASCPELWVIGSPDGAPDALRSALASAGAIAPGFVAELGEVLRPGDLHVLPWEHDTGTRTRIPLALAHGQALVSTRAAAACLAELEDSENCVLVDRLEEMPEAISGLLDNPSLRRRLALAGLDLVEKSFTRTSQQDRCDRFVAEVG